MASRSDHERAFELIVSTYPEITDEIAAAEVHWRDEVGGHNVFTLVAIVLIPYLRTHLASRDEQRRLAVLLNEMFAAEDPYTRAIADTGIVEGLVYEIEAAPDTLAGLSVDARRAYDQIRSWTR